MGNARLSDVLTLTNTNLPSRWCFSMHTSPGHLLHPGSVPAPLPTSPTPHVGPAPQRERRAGCGLVHHRATALGFWPLRGQLRGQSPLTSLLPLVSGRESGVSSCPSSPRWCLARLAVTRTRMASLLCVCVQARIRGPTPVCTRVSAHACSHTPVGSTAATEQGWPELTRHPGGGTGETGQVPEPSHH